MRPLKCLLWPGHWLLDPRWLAGPRVVVRPPVVLDAGWLYPSQASLTSAITVVVVMVDPRARRPSESSLWLNVKLVRTQPLTRSPAWRHG